MHTHVADVAWQHGPRCFLDAFDALCHVEYGGLCPCARTCLALCQQQFHHVGRSYHSGNGVSGTGSTCMDGPWCTSDAVAAANSHHIHPGLASAALRWYEPRLS